MLAGIKRDLNSPDLVAKACKLAKSILSAPARAPSDAARISQLRTEIGNIADAIASGMMRASVALGGRLSESESELEALQTAAAADTDIEADIARIIPGLPALYRKLVDVLESTLAGGDITRSREEIKRHIGMITVEADEREIRLFSNRGHVATALLRVSGANAIKFGSGGKIRLYPPLYLNPPAHAAVVCGAERHGFEYYRHGTYPCTRLSIRKPAKC